MLNRTGDEFEISFFGSRKRQISDLESLQALAARSEELLHLYIPKCDRELEKIRENDEALNVSLVQLKFRDVTYSFPYGHFLTFALLWETIARNQYDFPSSLKGMTVVDAGANIGVASIFAAALGAERIFAFEPCPQNFNLLKANLAANHLVGRVEAFPFALGEVTSQGMLGVSYSGSGCCSLALQNFWHREQIPVEIRRLDDCVDGPVAFLKLDVEGYEREVLRGATRIISESRPTIAAAAYHYPDNAAHIEEAARLTVSQYRASCLSFAENVVLLKIPGTP